MLTVALIVFLVAPNPQAGWCAFARIEFGKHTVSTRHQRPPQQRQHTDSYHMVAVLFMARPIPPSPPPR